MDKKLTYDLHIHSCLSPCGDDDMTPANIAGMGALNGLSIMALTDHNTCANCPPFFEACTHYGVVPIAGMELTTSEEIHVVCLFEFLEDALQFDAYVREHRLKIKNRVDIFGHQYIMDADETILGEDAFLLPPATSITLEEAFSKVNNLNGIAYPAHIDRTANGIIGVLGAFPEAPGFLAYELHDALKKDEYKNHFPILNGLRELVSSDAHVLWDISEGDSFLSLSEDAETPKQIRKGIFEYLRGNR